MQKIILLSLFATLLVTVYSLPLASQNVPIENLSSGTTGEAEAKSKLLENADELRKQVQGTIVRYYNDGKKSFSNLIDRAQTGLKKIGQSSGEQITKVFTSVRNTVTGNKEAPKDHTLSDYTNQFSSL